MLHAVTFRSLGLAACGWLFACDAFALTVGAARGIPLVGRPLDLAIPVTLDAPSAVNPCASAQVFYGEQVLARPPVIRWEPGSGAQGVLRISSPQPVDEPSVMLNLRVGCGAQGTERRFVLLSELPPAQEPAPSTSSQAVVPRIQAPARSTAAEPAAAGPGGAEPGRPAPRNPGPGSPRRRDPSPADAAVAALRAERALPSARAGTGVERAPAPRARRPESGTRQPRLRLEPLDLGPEREPTLRMSTELRTEVAADPQRRQAAAALWRALQKSPDEALQDALRLQGMERELQSLRTVTQQNAATVTRMRAEIDQTRGDRSLWATLVIVLSAILLALLGWLSWRWYAALRMDRVGRWFEQHGESGMAPITAAPITAGPPPPPPRTPAVAAVTARTKPEPWAAVRSAIRPEAGAAAAGAVAAAVAAPAPPEPLALVEEFQSSRNASMRMVGVEELLDVHDKADFFLSIGEYDQAIALLDAHVHDNVETSALAWMDLLELYHSLGRRPEYETLRREFRQRFTGEVPDFEHFDQPGATLENYGRALSRIVALWPSPRVLDVIEESIFRTPGMPGSEPFSLEAYRELVLLYHVARDIAQAEVQGAGGPRSTFGDTSLQPLSAMEQTHPGMAAHRDLFTPPASARLGVDIDIDEPPGLDFDLDEPHPRSVR